MWFDFFTKFARRIGKNFIEKESVVDDKTLLEKKIREWKLSKERIEAMQGEAYYNGYHDILYTERTAIGKGGKKVKAENVPDNKDIDNQYAIAVDKKANYFLGKPISFVGENKEYIDKLNAIFSMQMQKKLKNMAKDSMNGAIAWMFPYYDNGQLKFKVFPAYEIMPLWADTEHETLDAVLRVYPVIEYKNGTEKTVDHVEIYKQDGVYRYILTDGEELEPSEDFYSSYATIDGVEYNWDKIPLIPFKYNAEEIPLIRRVKGLQDALNQLISAYHNNMLEDARSTILIIENYDGQDLGEFRQNLNTYGAVKVRNVDGSHGGVSALQVEVNAENYTVILDLLKNAIIENARSYDGKMLKSGTPNQMNILSMYQDIDLDTNDFESEYQAGIEQLLYFINVHLSLTGEGDYFNEEVKVIFNRDMLMNESEIMTSLIQAGVKISNRTLLSQVPYIDDVDAELENIKEEQEEATEIYQNAFGGVDNGEETTE